MNAIVLALIVLLSQSAEERMRAGEFVEAAATLEEQLRQPGLSDTATAALLVELGNAYRSAGSPAGAEPHLQRAAALAEKAKDRGLLVSALHSLGMVIRQRGRGAAAEATFLRARAILEADQAPGRERAKVLSSLAALYLQSNRPQAAEEAVQEALRSLEQSPDAFTKAWALSTLGDLRYLQGKDREADRAFAQALALLPAEDTSPLRGVVLNNRGLVAYRQGALDRAASLWRESLTFYESHPRYRYWSGVSAPTANLGELQRSRKQTAHALSLFRRAVSMLEQLPAPDEFKIAQILNLLGATEEEAGRRLDARRTLARALSLAEKTAGPEHPQAAFILVNQGQLEMAGGHYAAAEARFDRAYSILNQPLRPADRHLLASLTGRAQALRKLKRKAEAHTLEQRAQEVAAFLPSNHTISIHGLQSQ